jgi:hypothetical protein
MIEPVVRIRIELEGTEPLVWRSVGVPLSSSLMALHDIIQVTMRWQDAHMFEFIVGDQVYGEPNPRDSAWDRKVFQAKSIRLKSLIDRGVDRFVYVYDFGDNWRITSSSKPSGRAMTTPITRPSSAVTAAHRPRMWAGSAGSRSSCRR